MISYAAFHASDKTSSPYISAVRLKRDNDPASHIAGKVGRTTPNCQVSSAVLLISRPYLHKLLD